MFWEIRKKNINEKSIRVKVGDAFYEAKVVDRDPVNRLALLRVENSTFSYLELVKDFNVDEKGSFVDKESVVMLKPAITTKPVKWVISTGRLIKIDKQGDMDVISASIKGGVGSSGSPVVNQYGQVIGMNFASKSSVFGTVNLLIPASSILKFIHKSNEDNIRYWTVSG